MDIQQFVEQRHVWPKEFDLADLEEYVENIEHIEYEKEPRLPAPVRKALIVKGIAQGIKFDSKWEYAFWLWCREIKGWSIERNHNDFLPYYDENGKERKWFFDFYVNGQMYEVKGRFKPSDIQKQQQHSEVVWITNVEMKPILKELNRHHPHWEDEYMPVSPK